MRPHPALGRARDISMVVYHRERWRSTTRPTARPQHRVMAALMIRSATPEMMAERQSVVIRVLTVSDFHVLAALPHHHRGLLVGSVQAREPFRQHPAVIRCHHRWVQPFRRVRRGIRDRSNGAVMMISPGSISRVRIAAGCVRVPHRHSS